MTRTTTDLLARETPKWFDEAKLGLFIHWSPASIPAYAPQSRVRELWDLPNDPDGVPKLWRSLPHAAMYQNTLAVPGSPTARFHAERYGDAPFDAFVEQFRDEMAPVCDPEIWADLADRVGARYVVLTTKLTDGFLLWPSAHPNPRRAGYQTERDIVGEAAVAVRAKGLRFGTYYCGGLDPTFGPLPVTDVSNTLPPDEDYLPYAEAHWRELIERYEPSIMWNDFCFPLEDEALRALFRSYIERVPDGVINNRFQDSAGKSEQPSPVYSDFTTPEYTTNGTPQTKWEACRAIGLSFGYNREESGRTYLSSTDLIHLFVDIVARGGNLLLNVNPTATGEIPTGEAERLLALGWWLRTNRGAIYGTRPWQRTAGITPGGMPIRYTASPDAVHALVLGTPTTAAVDLDVALAEGAEVTMEGRRGALPWTSTPTGVRIDLPEPPDAERATVTLRVSPAEAVRPMS
jgi:alpha-L-fucosidase